MDRLGRGNARQARHRHDVAADGDYEPGARRQSNLANRQNMAGRLGSAFPPEGFEWWTRFMGRTAVSTPLGFMGTIACADIRADLPKIACPTLVITTEQSGLGTVEETRAWQQQIPDSELLVLPGDSYHVAATHAESAADATLEFIARRGGAA